MLDNCGATLSAAGGYGMPPRLPATGTQNTLRTAADSGGVSERPTAMPAAARQIVERRIRIFPH